MKECDIVSSLVWIAVSTLFCWGSLDLGLGSVMDPGPGFFPFWMSLSLLLFSIGLFVASLLKKGRFYFLEIRRRSPDRSGFFRIFFTVVFLTFYTYALDYLGFALTTLLFMFLVLKVIAVLKWPITIFGSLLTTVGSYAVFEIWLRVNLPQGVLWS